MLKEKEEGMEKDKERRREEGSEKAKEAKERPSTTSSITSSSQEAEGWQMKEACLGLVMMDG